MSRRNQWAPRPSKRPRRIAAAIVLVGLAVFLFWARQQWLRVKNYPDRRMHETDMALRTLEIPRGSGLTQVIAQLKKAKVLDERQALYFKLYVLHRGMANQIKAGEHKVAPAMTPRDLIEELSRRPAAPTYSVTIPEGKHMLDIAKIFEKAGGPSEAEMMAAMRDPKLLASLEIPRKTAEGYLFPDTYRFARKDRAPKIVKRLVSRHQQIYAQLQRTHFAAAQRLSKEFGWGQSEILTLASIVEKETGVAKERPLIAGVFLNRLRFKSFKPKLLQTDPTIIYGCVLGEPKSKACERFEGRIRRIHLLDKDNPYSTYAHEGLPPGPISNPGKAAIEAVFEPTKSRFLFFVSRNDGTHKFSKSRAEHEAAVERHMRQGVVGDG